MSNGAQQGGMDASPAVEMAAFDSLPPELRALLNYAPLDYSGNYIVYSRASFFFSRMSLALRSFLAFAGPDFGLGRNAKTLSAAASSAFL